MTINYNTMNNELTIGTTIGTTILGLIVLSSINNKDEHFTSGFGFELPDSVNPIFLNMYSKNLSKDFGLFDVIQQLKYMYFKPNPRGIETNAGFGEVSIGASLAPVILVPGLGTSNIVGKWNKPNTKNVKSIKDVNFEESEKWNCRQIQENWTDLWFPQSDVNSKISQFCWEDNIKVEFKDGLVVNSEGVQTSVKDYGSTVFTPVSYMNTLLDAIGAIGYKEGSTLYGAQYDFRKICSPDELFNYIQSLKSLVERSVHLNGKKAVLVGHSLGSNLINYFLVKQSKEWKDRYINSFVSFSGAFGGCPKALRSMLSGVDVTKPDEKTVFHKIIKNFTGLQWMLPNPHIYGDVPLVHYKNVSYAAKDILSLLYLCGDQEAINIYKNVVLPVQNESLKAPGVPVYTFSGTNLMTESSYNYDNSLTDDPVKNYPYYQLSQAYANNFDYPQEFNGDGTIPHFALQLPLSWTTQQAEPIYYRFYNRAEHREIMDIEQPVKDFISILKQM